ncbi:hypothetical protein BSKO_14154 [Bryopsis sp. KO-2023]|nr:hypothetical protein BSKO_14154 [Bryopsis sp. KO-2023]
MAGLRVEQPKPAGPIEEPRMERLKAWEWLMDITGRPESTESRGGLAGVRRYMPPGEPYERSSQPRTLARGAINWKHRRNQIDLAKCVMEIRGRFSGERTKWIMVLAKWINTHSFAVNTSVNALQKAYAGLTEAAVLEAEKELLEESIERRVTGSLRGGDQRISSTTPLSTEQRDDDPTAEVIAQTLAPDTPQDGLPMEMEMDVPEADLDLVDSEIYGDATRVIQAGIDGEIAKRCYQKNQELSTRFWIVLGEILENEGDFACRPRFVKFKLRNVDKDVVEIVKDLVESSLLRIQNLSLWKINCVAYAATYVCAKEVKSRQIDVHKSRLARCDAKLAQLRRICSWLATEQDRQDKKGKITPGLQRIRYELRKRIGRLSKRNIKANLTIYAQKVKGANLRRN